MNQPSVVDVITASAELIPVVAVHPFATAAVVAVGACAVAVYIRFFRQGK